MLMKRIYSYWDRNGFKTLPGFYYVLGHFKFDIGRKAFADTIFRLYNCNERFIGIYFLFSPKLLLRDPELIRTVLIKDFAWFTDRGVHSNEELEPLSAHLFALPGEKWKQLRPKLSPTFSSGKLKAMFPTLIECGSTLQNHLNKLFETGDLLDITEISASYTTNFIASIAFGIQIDSINHPNNEFRALGRKITRPSLRIGMKRLLIIFVPKLVNILKLRFNDQSVDNFIMSLVKENLEYREKNNIVRKDFFQLLIQLRNSGSVQMNDDWESKIKSNESTKMMTVENMAAHSFLFLVAGFLTSSSTISFCLYELAKNPNIQQRVHNEIDRIFAKHKGQITYEFISELKFLELCIDGKCFNSL